ncbi:VRR-NUC domain-containing protein [Enterococcus sp. S86.2]|uniref:VRR-NUC domain-containing protein n=1 Tax=Enterococcus sp. S86.2 TaxID=3031299 RepID=UPI0026F1B16B|nr:VRR-NUC domain-containing protein [Enterococcus sp. S86.2]
MTAEIEIQNAIRRELPKYGHFVYRGNVGKVKMMDGRWFDTGLPKGWPDLFGWTKEGKFFAIEVKNETGKLRPDQTQFGEFLKRQPIIYGVARSVEDALRILEGGTHD